LAKVDELLESAITRENRAPYGEKSRGLERKNEELIKAISEADATVRPFLSAVWRIRRLRNEIDNTNLEIAGAGYGDLVRQRRDQFAMSALHEAYVAERLRDYEEKKARQKPAAGVPSPATPAFGPPDLTDPLDNVRLWNFFPSVWGENLDGPPLDENPFAKMLAGLKLLSERGAK
jgi:hypothetical protein